jgi:hypothetical protein
MAAAGDISALDQHFNQPGKDISPWMFVPEGLDRHCGRI